MQAHGHGTMEVLEEGRKCRMGGVIDVDDTLEVVTGDHRTNADETNRNGWNRQQDKRQRNHPRCLVRLLARRKTVVVVVRSFFVVMIAMVIMVIPLAEALLAVEDEEVHAE